MSRSVAVPSEYLAITSLGVDDIRLAKKARVLPGQRCSSFDVSPVNYTFEVQAMSAEKLPFVLLAVFTIGLCVDDKDSLLHYAKLKPSNLVNEFVQGVIEGETRKLSACMSMEEILKPTNEFTKEVFEKVQLQLNQFGLLIHNAEVIQLVDVRGHEYFSYLGQKTQMEAANDQAEASPSLNSAIGASGYADSAASSGIYPAWPPSPCEGHGNTETCTKCMYSKYQPKQVFQKILSLSDVQRKGSYRLYLPNRPHAARFCPPANGSEVSIYDVQMKRWPMHFRTSGGRAYLTRGWSCFAQATQLGEGDRITFYELNCKRGTGARVFMIGVSRKDCFQILGVPIN